ncbi:MAG: ABC-F family ATP-binding cassette domain-containing protein [Alphaproteobacteria bacterium]|nr:ABC-F family ATP-binding cassette domain-containing protein [Alphaproteobacteria bacterium]
MHILSAENLSLSFTEKPLFYNISFNINEGDKIGLIAKNGKGKSSLIKMLNNNEAPESSKIWLNKECIIIYLPQNPIFDDQKSVLENIFLIDNPIFNAIKNYENAQQSEDLEAISLAMEQIDNLQIWDIESTIHQVLTKLKIDNLTQTMHSLSGGQRKRVALAKVLIEAKLEPKYKLLLLDEPTNHLDFDMIEWLENFLKKEKCSILLVTHDRYFLDEVTNKIWELQESEINFFEAGYDHYLETKIIRAESMNASLQKAQNLFRRELEWMRKQPKARTSKSKSRQDNFIKIEQDAHKKIVTENVQLQMKMTRIGGKILELKKVYKSFDSKIILKGFDYTFSKGERIGIIGNNGVGKSTFIKILQQLEPPDSGKINIGETIVFGYYNQEGLSYKTNIRVIEYVKNIAENFKLANGGYLSAAQFLELFLFPPESQFAFLDSLSGGEKKRLLLLTILYKNPNFLILDEPTNDLDIPTLQVLENFLLEFKGCLIIISHDRFFLNKVVNHILIFKGEGDIHHFYGNYYDYKISEETNAETIKNLSNPDLNEPVSKMVPKDSNNTKNQKRSFNDTKELQEINDILPKLEQQKIHLTQELENKVLTYEEISAITQKIQDIILNIEKYENRWLELQVDV